jgi:hypothetical protein
MDEVMSAPAYYDVPPGRTIVKSSMEVPAKPDLSFAWQKFMPSRVVFEPRRPTLKKKRQMKKGEWTRSIPPPLLRQRAPANALLRRTYLSLFRYYNYNFSGNTGRKC